MTKATFPILLALLIMLPKQLHCWGFHAHKSINRFAVFTLPTEIIGFYKNHLQNISEHAVDPDKRRYVVEEEAARHYIDIDHYGPRPFEVMPKVWDKATEKFTEDTLRAYGIAPWHIERTYKQLVQAFIEHEISDILAKSADLGHYVADAHVPLHTTENYNGQFTNQKGIHGFWESRLPELFSGEYNFFVGKAELVDDPLKLAWDAIKASHAAVDSVLDFERSLNNKFPSDQKYAFEQRGQSTVKVYSEEYSYAYHQLLDGMVQRRMRASIMAVGSLWYSAWVEAGQPNLNMKVNEKQATEIIEARDIHEAKYSTKPFEGRGH